MSIVEVEDQGQVRVITLNRPERRNATSPELMAGVNEALTIEAGASIRAVVLTGNGPSFSAGGDLKNVPTMQPGSRRMRELYNPTAMRLATLPLPVVAAVNGPALGAGLSLALAADLRIASRSAVFSSGFVDIGLATDTGSSYFLPRLVGHGRAFEILTTGRKVGPEEALAIGLVTAVVEPDELLHHALELASRLASKPGIAVPALKELLDGSSRRSLADQLEAEAQMYDRVVADPGRAVAKRAMLDKMSSGSTTAPGAS